MSATSTELATTRPSNLPVRIRVAALKLLLCNIVCAQQTLFLRSVRDTPTFVFCFWIAIQKLLLANVR